jgi:hypothetical protein
MAGRPNVRTVAYTLRDRTPTEATPDGERALPRDDCGTTPGARGCAPLPGY